jgi:prepilin-type N-terminal cleavage/methylation domain-containing protein/prepilin-type processing-associated H-X9-DG protein
MAHFKVRRRTAFTLIELLVIMAIIGVLASMLVVAVQKARETSRRIDCVSQLRQLGISFHKYHDTVGNFPTEAQPTKGGQPSSIYFSILEYIEQSDAINNSQASIKMFLCPSRRTVKNSAGKRDYVYLTVSGGAGGQTGQAIFETSGGAQLEHVTNNAGTGNTAMFAHMWLAPSQYANWAADTGNDNWATPPSSVSTPQAQPDNRPGGDNMLGGPHPGGVPTLFADGHTSIIPYAWPQWNIVFDWTNTTQQVNFPN